MSEVDLAIVGGGLVGASLAIALRPTGLRVALVEGVAPDASLQPSFDDRTTALGNGTRRTFEALGLWQAIAPHAAPIRAIHVSDAGRFGFARLEAGAEGIEAFGYVVTNRALGAVLRAALADLPALDLRMPARVERVEIGAERVELHLAGAADPLRARLVVAADGAHSLVRQSAGLPAAVEDYGQVAIVAHVAAARRSDGTAYERFTPTGPLAVLPLHDGHFGIVWTLEPADAERVMALPDADYLAELQQCFGWRVGRLLRVGRRNAYPLRLTRAGQVAGARSVLVGNAAQALQERVAQGDAQITLKTRILRQVTFGKQRYRLALELHVMDNGPGVPDSIKDRIFFPLISGREGGSGLGLTLAQTFVQQHHGMIECDSEPGRTDFKILIPLP